MSGKRQDVYAEKFVVDFYRETLERARGYSCVDDPIDYAFVVVVDMVATTGGVTPSELGRHTLALVKARAAAVAAAVDTAPAAAQ